MFDLFLATFFLPILATIINVDFNCQLWGGLLTWINCWRIAEIHKYKIQNLHKYTIHNALIHKTHIHTISTYFTFLGEAGFSCGVCGQQFGEVGELQKHT